MAGISCAGPPLLDVPYWAVDACYPQRFTGPCAVCLHNLQHIVLALHNYHLVHGCFPPAYVVDKQGKPMHSWRVLILPYMDQDALYKMYDFTEPWDSPKNRKLAGLRPPEYTCPSDPSEGESGASQTSYLAVVGPNAAWAGRQSRKLSDFSGKERDSIMLVEMADSGIAWTEPRDFSTEATGPIAGKPVSQELHSNHGHSSDFFFMYDRSVGVNVAMADDSVWHVPSGALSAADLQRMLSVGGCEPSVFEHYADGELVSQRPNWPNIAALAIWLLSVGTLLVGTVRGRNAAAKSNSPVDR